MCTTYRVKVGDQDGQIAFLHNFPSGSSGEASGMCDIVGWGQGFLKFKHADPEEDSDVLKFSARWASLARLINQERGCPADDFPLRFVCRPASQRVAVEETTRRLGQGHWPAYSDDIQSTGMLYRGGRVTVATPQERSSLTEIEAAAQEQVVEEQAGQAAQAAQAGEAGETGETGETAEDAASE